MTEEQDNAKDALLEEQRTVKQWQQRIEMSEKYRDKMAARYRWKEIVESYKCHLAEGLQDADIYVPPLNYIFAYIKTEIPSISLRDPKLKVNPRKGSSIKSARILQLALSYLWRTKRTKRENKKNILDVKTVGHSWFKTGYTAEFGAIEQESGKTFEYIKSEDFFGYRVPWDKITFNPDAIDPPFDCAWIAQEVWFPLEKVKANPAFEKDVTALLQASSGDEKDTSTDTDNSSKPVKSDNPDKGKPDVGTPMVKLYEVWHKEGNEKFILSDQLPRFIQKPKEWPYEMNGFPFGYLCINDNPDSAYGIPDCFAFEPQVFELTKIRASELDHLKRYNRQLMARKGALSDDAKEQFSQGITGAVIEASLEANESLDNVIKPIPYPPLPADVYAVEKAVKEDMINVSGQSATERGATQATSTRTFRELAQMDRGAKNRRSDQVDTFEDFLEDIGRMWIALLKQYADVPFYVAVTGEEPQEILAAIQGRPSQDMPGAITAEDGFTFTKEDIQGEFDVEVVAGSTIPLDTQNRTQQLMETLSLLPQLGVMPGGPVIAAIGQGLAEELDMPEVEMAIKAEQELARQQAAKREQQAEQANQQTIAKESAEIELKSQKEARSQEELILKAYEIMERLKQENNKMQLEMERLKKESRAMGGSGGEAV